MAVYFPIAIWLSQDDENFTATIEVATTSALIRTVQGHSWRASGYCGCSQAVVMRYLLWYYRLICIIGNQNNLAHFATMHNTLTTLRTAVRRSLYKRTSKLP